MKEEVYSKEDKHGIDVIDRYQGKINTVSNKTLDEVKEQYRKWFPDSFKDLSFIEN
ncbi:hypothetical protein [Pseudolactococcus reticulitermitis]|uniref:Uncharacterized protein n=1 Tax=Pseudolactococcus reticulitermitis TaxID=2025039 RepID=A0A224X3A0_9LACT|nr:hypothetical protein [Lactococcus reticulitermitis]GAX48498.1 hypothetical protein RsY01_2127 [Lactococcus reticulitermitis]